uniref:Peptidase S8/S53 domain-containing protein n=1 Tax=Panagrolaimus davidi TaxID=227884 RepID=A0A914P5H9_9BILA
MMILFNKFQKNEKTIEDLMQWKDRIIDCIVWYDGKKWRACIDTSFLTTTKETWFSNLTDLKTLTNYDDNNYEFTNLINKWLYCINVLNDGNLLQIQCPHIDHASIVANVAAAFYPDKSSERPLFSSIPEQYSKISDEIFIIGSFFTSEIKDILPSGYNGETADTINKYSSKGPFLSTGARGIDFVAPGEAITNLPKWYPNKNTDFNGTSLAAPNAAGSIACLLSALKANEISYSPATIKMALANTAFLPKNANKLEFGNGIIQICDAFEFIKKSINFFPKNFIVPISVNDPKLEKGIIFVKSDEIQSKNYCVNIKPKFNTKWILKCTDQSFN